MRPIKEDGCDGSRAWLAHDDHTVVREQDGRASTAATGSQGFAFDRVFGEASTRDVYASIASPLLHEALKGTHCTVYAYGQTGARWG